MINLQISLLTKQWIAETNAQLKRFEDLAGRAMYMAADDDAEDAQTNTLLRDRTDEPRRKIGLRDMTPYEVQLRAMRPHVSFVHNGSAARTTGTHGRASRFEVNGVALFRNRMHHPGNESPPFLPNAASAQGSRLGRSMEHAARMAFGG